MSTISSMRSKRTSRYRTQHEQPDDGSPDTNEESKDLGNIYEAMFAPKKPQKRQTHITVHE
jgi:hypothetical protein